MHLYSGINQYYLVKGDTTDDSTCNEISCDTKLAEESEVHAVRCCSDTQISGWLKQPQCSVWATADKLGGCNALNWKEANTLCISNGGRLCTKSELESNCAKDSGCRYDFRRVWSSTAGKFK